MTHGAVERLDVERAVGRGGLTIAEAVPVALRRLGYTLPSWCEARGLDRTTLYRLLTGRLRFVGESYRDALVAELGVSRAWLDRQLANARRMDEARAV